MESASHGAAAGAAARNGFGALPAEVCRLIGELVMSMRLIVTAAIIGGVAVPVAKRRFEISLIRLIFSSTVDS